ncbi:E3 ubiquitin-protein ligase hyd-like isoform X1 [Carassius carassius]|uniref:E3 ubiquitin-protein ligase hyd-like isoform X1 n=1 Tax=Carassius carassius TaxID=217509 RepID=UPI002868D978|nr:E3 ubiquitin-protein ligase hyd-like isoform X1 [Carassius carassius]
MEDDGDLETLGEKLYDLIYPKYTEMTPKLTGMLLELPASVVSQMLYDEGLLNKALERALSALTSLDNSDPVSHTDDAASVSSDSVGEQLYDLIDLYNTGHTQKITGMLLEQKKEAVLQLLSDHSLLEEQVKIALKTLQEQGDEETDVSDDSDREEVESIGETLFNAVHQLDPTHCADITGMLLEMDSRMLKQILSNRSMLEVAVQRAKSALEGALSPTHSEMSA